MQIYGNVDNKMVKRLNLKPINMHIEVHLNKQTIRLFYANELKGRTILV